MCVCVFNERFFGFGSGEVDFFFPLHNCGHSITMT